MNSQLTRSSSRMQSTQDYLQKIGVPQIAPHTSPFDPGYDPATLESHLEQSAHLMSILKISMACWMIAAEPEVRWARQPEGDSSRRRESECASTHWKMLLCPGILVRNFGGEITFQRSFKKAGSLSTRPSHT